MSNKHAVALRINFNGQSSNYKVSNFLKKWRKFFKDMRVFLNYVIIAFFITTISSAVMAETFQLNELEVGECQQLFYDDQSGKIIMRQDVSKCSEWEASFEETNFFGMLVTLLSKAKTDAFNVEVGVVVNEKNAERDDYVWQAVDATAVADWQDPISEISFILPPDLRSVVSNSISEGKAFNVGLINALYWSGNLYKVSANDLAAAKSAKKLDFKLEFSTMSDEKRKKVQFVLKSFKYYKSNIDGLYGAGTKKALGTYHSKHHVGTNIFDEILMDSNYLNAIHVSDDLDKHAAKMVASAKRLVRKGKCTFEQLEEFGGWVKSGKRSGQYFLDCGEARYWFNPNSNSPVTKSADHLSEATARDACWKFIKNEAPRARIQALNNSYTKHKVGSVTFRQGFKVKNAFGQTLKYYANCVIQNDRTMKTSIQPQ